MWFKHKRRNRRLGREHVLDVKLRSSQVRAARNRFAALGLGALFMTVLVAYGLWWGGQWALDRLVYRNRAFSIRELDLSTDGVIALDQLRRWSGVRPGDNLLALDLAAVKRDLELIPCIDSASVERIPPHTLRIRVFEREPIAQATVPRPSPQGGFELATYLIDTNGCVMLPLDPRQRANGVPPVEPLPVICPLDPNDLQPGRRLKTPQLSAALDLLRGFDGSPMAGFVEIKRIDLSAADALTVTTDQGAEITFGLTGLERQLRRWHQVYDRGQRENKNLASLDLAVTNNVPARWLQTSAAPISTNKAPKPLRIRKKHV